MLGSDTPALPGLRTFIVPPDIVAVPRRSPVRVRKRTAWKPITEGQTVDRTGGRDWFGDHLSSHAARPRSSSMYAASMVINIAAVAGIAALMLNRQRPAAPEPEQPLFVSVALALGSPIVPEIEAPEPVAASQPSRAESLPKAETPAVAIESAPAAPIDAPSSIQPEMAAPPPGPSGPAVGTPEGGERAVTGSEGTGSGDGKGTAQISQGPIRLGAGIQPPKKVKDVKALYPEAALASQLRGTVVIEATIGVDGRVLDAVVRRSIPGLDQAALDAVRQWEYEPALMNGVPVAVIMTVTVAFAIL